MKPISLIVGKFALGAAIVGYIFYKYVDWSTLEAHVSQSRWIWLLALAIHSVAFRFVTARQIRAGFEPYNIVARTWPIMEAQYISSFCTLILPGDIVAGGVTWHLLAKDHGHPIHVGSVLIFMRVLNLVALIPFAMLGIWAEPRLAASQAPLLAGIASLGFLVICLPFVSGRAARAAQRASAAILKPVKWSTAKRLHTRIWESVHASSRMSASFKRRLLLYALGLQLFPIIRFWMLCAMAGLTLPWSTGLWIVAMLAIVNSLPLTIGGLGVRELSLVVLFQTLYSVPAELSIWYSALSFASTILFSALPGAFFLSRR